MRFHNILRQVDVRRAMNAQAAGATNVNGTVIDMTGYDTIVFVGLFGALTATQVTGLKVQEGDAADGSDMADLAGSAVGPMADADGNKLLAEEVYRPRKRYVRCVVTRKTANAVVDGVVALLAGGEATPPAQHSTLSLPVQIVADPAEGTA